MPLTLGHCVYLSHNLAPVFLRERELVRDRYDPDAHAVEVHHAMQHGACALDEQGRPLVAGGLAGPGPGVVHTFLFGTAEWEVAYREIARYARRLFVRALKVDGVHRVQCISACLHPETGRFFATMGLTLEHELRGWGKNGETFYLFAKVREDAPCA